MVAQPLNIPYMSILGDPRVLNTILGQDEFNVVISGQGWQNFGAVVGYAGALRWHRGNESQLWFPLSRHLRHHGRLPAVNERLPGRDGPPRGFVPGKQLGLAQPMPHSIVEGNSSLLTTIL